MKLKSLLILIILVSGYSGFGQDTQTFPSPAVHSNPVRAGETLDYKVTFGFFTVGKAQINTSPKLFKVNGHPCYKIEIKGQTSGAVDWVAKVDDTWGTYMDTLTFMPYMGYRTIKENSYRKNETTIFDQKNLMVELKVIDQKTGKYKESEIFQTIEPVRDLVSGYSYLRTLDYDSKKVGDTISLYGIFEDDFYDFKILYAGKEVLKTNLGRIKTYKLIPVMPDNQLFAGKNAITIWLSDDAHKIPLKIEANMVIGKAGCEITSFNRPENKKTNQ